MDIEKSGKSYLGWDTPLFLAIIISNPDNNSNLVPSCVCAVQLSAL